MFVLAEQSVMSIAVGAGAGGYVKVAARKSRKLVAKAVTATEKALSPFFLRKLGSD